jgi:hypothetical protein
MPPKATASCPFTRRPAPPLVRHLVGKGCASHDRR